MKTAEQIPQMTKGVQYTLEYQSTLPKFKRSISCLGWAYNEELLIESYLFRVNELLKNTVEDYEIIIVDDGSTDKTKAIIQSIQKEIPQIKLIENEVNVNIGQSFLRALKNATKDYVFWQTIDWAYDLKYFRIFLELLKKYDIVMGVRRGPIKKKGNLFYDAFRWLQLFRPADLRKRSDNPQKAFISSINFLLVRLLFWVPLSDFQNIPIYPRELIQSLNYESESTFAGPEGLIKAYWKGAKIMEVPVSFIPRQLGEAKGTKLVAIKNSIRDIVKCWVKWMLLGKRDFRAYGEIKRLDLQDWELEGSWQ